MLVYLIFIISKLIGFLQKTVLSDYVMAYIDVKKELKLELIVYERQRKYTFTSFYIKFLIQSC